MVEDRLLCLVVTSIDVVDKTDLVRLGVQATLDGHIIAEFLLGGKHQQEHDSDVPLTVLVGQSASDLRQIE